MAKVCESKFENTGGGGGVKGRLKFYLKTDVLEEECAQDPSAVLSEIDDKCSGIDFGGPATFIFGKLEK